MKIMKNFFSVFCRYRLDHDRKAANDVWKGKRVQKKLGDAVGSRRE
jgi:hypothetical protein